MLPFRYTRVVVASPAYAQDAPTFSNDVAPVLFENCVVCHRPGEVAPMSLTTYREVRRGRGRSRTR